MLVVAICLSAMVGLVLGVLGGGGAVLAMPILLYVAHVEPRAAIASSLMIVGLTSGLGALLKSRAGEVRWRQGLTFALAGMGGAFAGARLAAKVPPQALIVSFAALMLVSAWFMLRPLRAQPTSAHPMLVLPVGLLAGLITGAVGAGGGFIVVPALVLVLNVPMRHAIGTSLLVIALQCLAALAGQLIHVDLDWNLALAMAGSSAVGLGVGVFIGGRTPHLLLRRAFAALMIVVALYMGARELIFARGAAAGDDGGGIAPQSAARPSHRFVAFALKRPSSPLHASPRGHRAQVEDLFEAGRLQQARCPGAPRSAAAVDDDLLGSSTELRGPVGQLLDRNVDRAVDVARRELLGCSDVHQLRALTHPLMRLLP